MKNKTVIRKENEKGKFTTIHHSILKDKRLSSNGFRLLVNILSDSDENFKLSPTVYCNRLGITKTTFLNAIKNLEDCGYIKREDSKIVKSKNHYTVSEYGNLKKKPHQDDEVENESTNLNIQEEPTVEYISEYSEEFENYVYSLDSLLAYVEFQKLFFDVWIEKLKINTVGELKKKVNEYLKSIYTEKLLLAKSPEKYPKAYAEFKSVLKDEIFIKYNLNFNASNTWSYLSLIKHKRPYKTDYETLMGDYYENPKD